MVEGSARLQQEADDVCIRGLFSVDVEWSAVDLQRWQWPVFRSIVKPYLNNAYMFWRRLWFERSSMLEGFHFSSLALPRTILSLYHSTDGAHATRKRNDKTPLDKLHI